MRTVLLCTLLLFVSAGTAVSRQQSDRAVVDQFKKIIQELTLLADSAQSVQDCAEINTSVNDLERDFADYKPLLNRSLYPDDYDETIEKLRARLIIRQKDLGVIETQFVRISDLEAQVRLLTGRVDSLTTENERLLGSVKDLSARAAASKAVYDSLTTVIGKLRRNLEARDQLIFSLLDSLFLQYDKNVASMNDIEKQGVYAKLEKRNVLSNIRKSIDDNLRFLESTSLTPEDYVEIARQNQRFTNQWKGIAPKLANIYLSGKQKKNEVAAIDSLLAQWSERVDRSNWKTLAALFSKNGFALKPFSNGNEFTASIVEFVEREVKAADVDSPDVRARRYNTFNDRIWKTELKPVWLPILVESGKLTKDQQEQIESRVDGWRSTVSPISWMVYAAIGLVVILLAAGFVLYRRKKAAPPAE